MLRDCEFMSSSSEEKALLDRWEPLRERVQQVIGPVFQVRSVRGRHARSQCLQLRTVTGCYYLKLYDSGRGFEQEHFFYERLAGALSGTARMVEQWPAERGLLICQVPGEQVAARGAGVEVYRRAGEALRRLHRLPWKDEDIDLRSALMKRVEAFRRGSEGFLSSAEADGVAGPVEELLSAAEGLSRVYCHRDYAEYNWLHGPEGFFVIDFEHGKGDHWLLDLCLLKGTSFADERGVEEAFWQGYGGGLTDWERAFLSRWTAMWAQQTRIWGERHNDEYCTKLGQRVLRGLEI